MKMVFDSSANLLKNWIQKFSKQHNTQRVVADTWDDYNRYKGTMFSNLTNRVEDSKGGEKYNYNALFIHGGAGIGKTSLVEAVCKSENITLEKINCFEYGKFRELKKKYIKVVKVETISHCQISIGAIFKNMKEGNKPQTLKKGKCKSMCFLVQNIEYLVKIASKESEGEERIIAQMLDFFQQSQYPFVVEATVKTIKIFRKYSTCYFDELEIKSMKPDFLKAFTLTILTVESLINSYSLNRLVHGSKVEAIDNKELLNKMLQNFLSLLNDHSVCSCLQFWIQQISAITNLVNLSFSNLNSILSSSQFFMLKSSENSGMLIAKDFLWHLGFLENKETLSRTDPDKDTIPNNEIDLHFRESVGTDVVSSRSSLTGFMRTAEFLDTLNRTEKHEIRMDLLRSQMKLERLVNEGGVSLSDTIRGKQRILEISEFVKTQREIKMPIADPEYLDFLFSLQE